jgi:hypothetical protein
MNIYNELRFGLYENPEIQNLDPLMDSLRNNPFHDIFWDLEEDYLEDPLELV